MASSPLRNNEPELARCAEVVTQMWSKGCAQVGRSIGRDIEQAGATDGCVDGKALRRIPGATDVALKQVIHCDGGLPEIADEVVQTASDAPRKIIVTACDRLQHVAIHKLIAGENHPVRRLRGIMVLSIFGERLGIRRNMGACEKAERGCQHDSAARDGADVTVGRLGMSQRGVSSPDDSET